MIDSRISIKGATTINPSVTKDGSEHLYIDDNSYSGYLEGKNIRLVDRLSQIVLANAVKTIEQANEEITEDNSHDFAFILGTEYGPIDSIHKFDMESLTKGASFVNPGLFPNTVLNSPACQSAIQLNISGPILTVSNGITSGLDSIILACNWIQANTVSKVIIGGADEISEFPNTILNSGRSLHETSGFLILEKADDVNNNLIIAGFESGSVGKLGTSGARVQNIINKVIEDSGVSMDSIEAIDLSLRLEKNKEQEIIESIQALKNNTGQVKKQLQDRMAASGINQIIEKYNKQIYSNELFVAIDNYQISVVLVKRN